MLMVVVVSQEIKITAANATVVTGMKTLHGHFESVWKTFKSSGQVAATDELRLAIGLPLRDPAGLEIFSPIFIIRPARIITITLPWRN